MRVAASYSAVKFQQRSTKVFPFQWLCRSLTLIIKYLRMCQYAWMFCEGYYLHKILVTAFKEQKSMLPFYAFGWG